MNQRLLCKKCFHVFDLAVPGNTPEKEPRCPACDAADIMDAPPWAPLNSGLNIFFENDWSYECQSCKYQFRMPIPKSPAEDKSRKCPECQSNHLHLITGSKSLPLYCG